jgi:two-component system, OmpR family, sensor histidine kinase CiaH
MFTRARLHLTLLYSLLLGLTVVVVAGAIGILAVQEARSSEDRQLQIRAQSMAAAVPPGPPPSPSGPPPIPGPPPGVERPPLRLEQQGLLEYFLPVRDGQILTPPFGGLSGLPDLSAAEQAMQSGKGQFNTVKVSSNDLRTYTLPVVRDGRTDAVVQVGRSLYFVNAAVADLALIAVIAGAAGLALSAAAGYWLAGRTLRPISQAMDRQRNFASDASHELRTPLTVILTNAELLTLHPERSLVQYQDVVSDIIVETQRLSRLVGDLLTLARADQGTAALSLANVDLSEIAGTVTRQFESVAVAKGLRLESAIEPAVFVSGDADRLQQLAVILIDNAIRYTSTGRVRVEVSRERGTAVLSVSDTGPGIAPEHHQRLFERFYRIDAARSSQDGTGLGLALAKWIVESHHGRIDLASTPGAGTTFTVSLPASPAPLTPHDPSAADRSPVSPITSRSGTG